MAQVIIGVHGLSNKPSAELLHEWWLKAINDGLNKVGVQALGATQFKLAYWADLMYASADANPEPYTDPGTDEVDDDPSKLIDIGREFFSDTIGKFGDLKVQMTDTERIEGIKNAVRKKIVKDLAAYYDDNSTVQFGNRVGAQTRLALRAVLQELIEQHQADDVLLIGHSMGSIIAYDVLRSLRDTSIRIRQFITIGSPLGLANVKVKTQAEWDGGKDGPFVPEILTESWVNHGDRKDLVCADLTLNGEYEPSGGIDVQDVLVSNGYRHTKHNHHKSYGYLRTGAFAKHLKLFLEG